jgi:hypothetical protein
MDARTLRNIQILALDAVENPDFDAFYRRITRWYSEKFSTPLPEVMDLDPIHVFQTYYEERFSAVYVPGDERAMEEYQRIKNAVCFPDEVAAMEAEDDDWEQQMLKDIESQNAQAAKKAEELVSKRPEPEQPPNIQEKLDNGEEVVFSGEQELPSTFED